METYSLKQLWIKACEYDSIEPESKFVVFSTANPWAKKYNTLACLITQDAQFAKRYPNLSKVSRAPANELKVCGRCSGPKPAGQSCGCFDNNCQ